MFDAQKQRIVMLALVGFLLGAIGLLAASLNMTQVPRHLAVLPGGALLALTVLYGQWFAFRCPRCGGAWNGLAMQNTRNFFVIDKRIRYCPYCGSGIDAGEPV